MCWRRYSFRACGFKVKTTNYFIGGSWGIYGIGFETWVENPF